MRLGMHTRYEGGLAGAASPGMRGADARILEMELIHHETVRCVRALRACIACVRMRACARVDVHTRVRLTDGDCTA